MKILFLDIDGVLNSEAYRQTVIMRSLLADETSIDPQAVLLLQSLIESFADLKIVISSSWRKVCSMEELKKILSDLGLDVSRIIDYTPVMHNVIRGEEIKSWLRTQMLKSDFPIHQYVILDDDSDMGTVSSHLIQTNYKIGLTPQDLDSIKTFFKKQPLMNDMELFN